VEIVTMLADLIRGREHLVRWYSGQPSEGFTFDEKVQINLLDYQGRHWADVENDARLEATREAEGWTRQEDGSHITLLPNGTPLTCWGGARWEEDGQVVDTSTRSEQWLENHRRLTRDFAARARGERLVTVRSRTRWAPQRRAREHRPVATRRTSSSSRTSSADPGDSDGEPEPPLRAAPKPPAIYTYGALTAEARGADVLPPLRTSGPADVILKRDLRHLIRAGYAELDHGILTAVTRRGVRSWPASEIREIRWLTETRGVVA
jgi:hypothetical protein